MSPGCFGGFWLGIDRRDAHEPHQSLNPLAVDAKAAVFKFVGDPAAAQEGPCQMNLVDGSHDR